MQTGALPRSWRDDRAALLIRQPAEGWLVDVEHPDSISALEPILTTHLLVGGYATFTTAALRSDDRALTTAIADIVHDASLDDGSHPMGIHFGSKFGGGLQRQASPRRRRIHPRCRQGAQGSDQGDGLHPRAWGAGSLSGPKPFLDKHDDVADWTAIPRNHEVYLYREGELFMNEPVRITQSDQHALWWGTPADLDAGVAPTRIVADSD
ncbi:hypothetical protein EDF63_0559 [Curtobacterium sp. JUb34]|nr:hypothetical protein EDF63_0559 [Curtobacterium sp. JUb34]